MSRIPRQRPDIAADRSRSEAHRHVVAPVRREVVERAAELRGLALALALQLEPVTALGRLRVAGEMRLRLPHDLARMLALALVERLDVNVVGHCRDPTRRLRRWTA